MQTLRVDTAEEIEETIAALRQNPRASDIHLDDNAPAAIRIDGDLIMQPDTITTTDAINGFLTEIERNKENIKAQREHRGVYVIVHESPEMGRLRIAVYQTGDGKALAIRLLPTNPPNLSELSLPVSVNQMTEKLSGLGIISGPNGVGKSHLLAAITQQIADNYKKVIYTLDEGREFVYKSTRSKVRQLRIGEGLDAKDYAVALDGLLVGNPDVVVVSECRTPDAILAALLLAETGVRVLITLHLESATRVVDRIVGAFKPEMQPNIRVMLANTLDEVVYMRLPKRIKATEQFGRVPACEIFWRTDVLSHTILDEQNSSSTDVALKNYIANNRKVGMQLLEDSLADLAQVKKIISVEEARKHALRPEDLDARLGLTTASDGVELS